MTFISTNLGDDVQEAGIAPEGEYTLRIVKAEAKESKNGNPMIEMMIAFESEENYAPINHYLNLPYEGNQWNDLFALSNKRFLVAFGISFNNDGFDVEDFAGSVGTMKVTQEQGEGEYADRTSNAIKPPPLPRGSEEAPKKRRGRAA
jgi:hypothetical protein